MYEEINNSENNKSIPKKMNQDDFSRLYDLYANDVIRVCYFYLKDMQRAEDICQDTFIKLISSSTTLEAGKEKSWLLKVAINRCKDYWKSSWFKRVTLGDDSFDFTNLSIEHDHDDVKQELLSAISKLPPKFKETVLLHYYQGLGINEISNVLNISPGTVSSRLSRAREKLAISLRGSDENEI